MEGYIRASDIAKERVDDASQFLKVGEAIEAKFIGMDRKGRVLQLSIRAKDEAEVQQVMDEYQATSSAHTGTSSLGALLREKMGKVD